MAEIHPKHAQVSQSGTAPARRKKRTTHETRPTRESGEVPTGTMAMAIAMSHPLRVRILYAMNSPERHCSATDIAEQTGVDVRRLSYHMRELTTLGFIKKVGEKPVRGSLEKIYAPIKRLEAWDQEYAAMPPALKQILNANVMKTGVFALGAAVDGGTFDARDDSIVGQDSFWTDERGAEEAMAILDDALRSLLELKENAKARLAETGEEGFVVNYLLAGYEGSIRPA
jgi:DNA-binding transcriptional ArsR family regulator